MEVKMASSDEDIMKCWEVFYALRPHLKKERFIHDVRKTLNDNRMMIFLEKEDKAVSASVFEWGYNLYRSSYIYIDDLSCLPSFRGKGYASLLLDWIIDYARKNNFDQVHLDSGVNANRWDAHRLYLNKRFNITSLHLALELNK